MQSGLRLLQQQWLSAAVRAGLLLQALSARLRLLRGVFRLQQNWQDEQWPSEQVQRRLLLLQELQCLSARVRPSLRPGLRGVLRLRRWLPVQLQEEWLRVPGLLRGVLRLRLSRCCRKSGHGHGCPGCELCSGSTCCRKSHGPGLRGVLRLRLSVQLIQEEWPRVPLRGVLRLRLSVLQIQEEWPRVRPELKLLRGVLRLRQELLHYQGECDSLACMHESERAVLMDMHMLQSFNLACTLFCTSEDNGIDRSSSLSHAEISSA